MKALASFLPALIAVSGVSAIVVERTGIPVRDPERRVYAAATRSIPLADGSEMLFYEDRSSDGNPPGFRAWMSSARGSEENRYFSVERYISSEILPGTRGQLLSSAMSADHTLIAFVGGWAGVRDHRGHNGIFILRQEEKSGYWRDISWFDAPGVTLGEIAFGPADTLLVTTHERRPDGGAAPILTVYSLVGQKLGAFLEDPQHGEAAAARFPRQARIARVDETHYAVLDPESATVRFIQVAVSGANVSVSETRRVNVPFDLQQCVIAAFDVLPDGRAVVARTVVQEHRGRTLISVIDATGAVQEEEMPETWRFGSIADGRFHGVSAAKDAYEYGREMRGSIR